jgi:hypothetical protein
VFWGVLVSVVLFAHLLLFAITARWDEFVSFGVSSDVTEFLRLVERSGLDSETKQPLLERLRALREAARRGKHVGFWVWLDYDESIRFLIEDGNTTKEDLRSLARELDSIEGLLGTRAEEPVRPTRRARDPVFTDANLEIMWTVRPSPTEMTWNEAKEYVENLAYHGHSDWRLPTRDELESIVSREVLDQEHDADHVALRKPFRRQPVDYMFSGTMVRGYEEAPYVMNAWTGHTFNGKGRKAHVRAVRDVDGGRGAEARPPDGADAATPGEGTGRGTE